MNCKECRDSVLLADSNELAAGELNALHAHLATCPACSDYAEESSSVTELSRSTAVEGPSPFVLNRIMAEARQQLARPKRLMFFPRPVAQALAWAAALAVVLGGWLVLSNRQGTDRVEHLNTILVVLSEEPADGTAAWETEPCDDPVQALARELLMMEGLSDDGAADEESLELLPTALQYRNMPAPPARICV